MVVVVDISLIITLVPTAAWCSHHEVKLEILLIKERGHQSSNTILGERVFQLLRKEQGNKSLLDLMKTLERETKHGSLKQL